MNERIKQLAKEARLLTGWPVGEVEFEKFAELIVQSCLTQIALIGISNLENDEHGDIGWTVTTSIDMIRDHFGVDK